MTDFSLENHGSLYLLIPDTLFARAHASEVFWDAQHLGHAIAIAIAIEPRYAPQIAEALLGDGFTLTLNGEEIFLADKS